MSRDNDLIPHVIAAVKSGYAGPLPSDPCDTCGGRLRVTHTTIEKGGWVMRRLACNSCGTKFGKWVVSDADDPTDTG